MRMPRLSNGMWVYIFAADDIGSDSRRIFRSDDGVRCREVVHEGEVGGYRVRDLEQATPRDGGKQSRDAEGNNGGCPNELIRSDLA